MQAPKPQKYIAKFEDKIVHNQKYTQFAFELIKPHRISFIAGQYLSLKISELGERRSYSICSSPGIKHGVETLVDLTPEGDGSTYLKNLEFGDQVEFLAPMGQFIVSDQVEEEELIFVATGSGISPIHAMILDLLQEKRDQRPIHLYWGLRYVDNLFWQNQFEELVESFENFSFTPVLSQPPPEWPLSRGRVTDVLAAKEPNPQAGYYLCGNSTMITEVTAILQEVPVKRIHHEQFY